LDQNVELSTVDEGYYAVIRYSGRSSNSNFLSHSNILQNELLTNGINILSKPIKATYNGPFTPGFMRRNEAMFLVEWKS
ncbi:MAG: heme-binding protein, partial [Alphaproteobacteria bacterium]|nr:heme-binding protein [Alphaproteobacteria bacterium]